MGGWGGKGEGGWAAELKIGEEARMRRECGSEAARHGEDDNVGPL